MKSFTDEKKLKKIDYTSYEKYENFFKIGIFLIIASIISLISSVQLTIDIPSWLSMLMVFFGLVGLVLCVVAGILYWRLTYHGGSELDDKQKKNMGKSALYAMFITIFLSFIIISILSYSNISLEKRNIITIPLVILVVSYTIILTYFNKIKSAG